VRIPDQTHKHYAEAAIEADKAVNSLYPFEHVYSANVSIRDIGNAFNSAITAVIDPFIAGAYDGINTQNSDLALAICVALPLFDEKSIGSSYATLLGLYRAVTELGITIEDLSLKESDSEPSVSIALRAYKFGERAEFITKLSKEELTDSFWKDAPLPDFEKIRALINGKSHT
jgi:hypothetical protein